MVIPSLEESLANAALEAMASGLPIITTATGVSELIEDNGIIVDKKNPLMLGEAIIKLIEETGLREKYAHKSRLLAEKYGWENVAASYLQIYENIIGAQ